VASVGTIYKIPRKPDCFQSLESFWATPCGPIKGHWNKFREECDFVDQILNTDSFVRDGITSQFVAELWESDPINAVIATVIWGYPRQDPTRGKMIEAVISKSEHFAETISGLRRRTDFLPAEEILQSVNTEKYVKTSTTTKMLCFARIESKEGPCLIFDKVVINAIERIGDSEFVDVRKSIISKKSLASKQRANYGPYVAVCKILADKIGVSPYQMERCLFHLGR